MKIAAIKMKIRNFLDFILVWLFLGNTRLMLNLLRGYQMTTYLESQFLFECAKNSYGQGVIVEIGSCTGRSTMALAAGSKLKGREKIYSIDPQEDIKIRKIFEQNIKLARIDDYVNAQYLKSEDAVKNFNSKARIVFVDGSHLYEDAKKDILLWKQFLIDGGLIIVHDYRPQGHVHYVGGVNKAIEECIIGNDEFVVEGVIDCSFVASKRITKNKKLIDKFMRVNEIRNKIKKIVDKSFLQVREK